MTLRRGVFATIVLLLGSASAFAQVPVPVRFVEYSAKFLCGDARDPTAAAVRPGIYETSINIHNPELPGTQQPVTFVKKAVRAPREGEEPFKNLGGLLSTDCQPILPSRSTARSFAPSWIRPP
jgi:hypothetical protein